MTNAGLVKQFLDKLVNHKQLSAIEHYLAENLLEHERLPAGLPATREGLRQLFELLYKAFPDMFVVIEDTVIEADKVVVRQSWTGTHQGELFGLAATGKRIQFNTIDIVRIEGEKIVEHWGETSWLELLKQLELSNHDKP